ncbi:spermine synthase [Oleiharenicola lentus]|uniref:spermine synthase n=1 Tax=Oleiharenicola lentus TaxID=2508720 RepID=UPI003F66BAFF
MKPNILLAETQTPNGSRMTLVEHDGSYCIRVNGQQLMHSSVSTSEVHLGALGCEHHTKAKAGLRVLIGGLGLGFTLKSVLQSVGPKAVVHVAELFPEIVEWNRTHLAKLNGDALKDSRVKVFVKDVRALINHAPREPYDCIILDIDNGTTAMVAIENHELYSEAGVRRIADATKSGGRATIWSACPDGVLEKRMKRAGLAVTAVPSKLYATAKRAAYMIYVGDKAAATPAK